MRRPRRKSRGRPRAGSGMVGSRRRSPQGEPSASTARKDHREGLDLAPSRRGEPRKPCGPTGDAALSTSARRYAEAWDIRLAPGADRCGEGPSTGNEVRSRKGASDRTEESMPGAQSVSQNLRGSPGRVFAPGASSRRHRRCHRPRRRFAPCPDEKTSIIPWPRVSPPAPNRADPSPRIAIPGAALYRWPAEKGEGGQT